MESFEELLPEAHEHKFWKEARRSFEWKYILQPFSTFFSQVLSASLFYFLFSKQNVVLLENTGINRY